MTLSDSDIHVGRTGSNLLVSTTASPPLAMISCAVASAASSTDPGASNRC